MNECFKLFGFALVHANFWPLFLYLIILNFVLSNDVSFGFSEGKKKKKTVFSFIVIVPCILDDKRILEVRSVKSLIDNVNVIGMEKS